MLVIKRRPATVGPLGNLNLSVLTNSRHDRNPCRRLLIHSVAAVVLAGIKLGIHLQ